ncbi:hypothetical protein JCM18694_18190 [Prolixibacter denitrificans]|uniref:Uncharacterized protein n=1 Tax=Prolixibacter denitrificans TaxID=1541063 RepID=A0ABQ0ZJQ5_9BACT|nr:hypothetical protein JCM18694_18190 [Prolixibacter denitrificans]
MNKLGNTILTIITIEPIITIIAIFKVSATYQIFFINNSLFLYIDNSVFRDAFNPMLEYE